MKEEKKIGLLMIYTNQILSIHVAYNGIKDDEE